MKKTLLLTLASVLVLAGIASAQEPAPPAPPAAPAAPGNARQFVGDVVATDLPTSTLTVKATGVDAKGDPVERTVTLAVEDALAPRLASLQAGDKVTVLWRRDEAKQRDVAVAIEKMPAAPSDKS
jgi:hypothetical protein